MATPATIKLKARGTLVTQAQTILTEKGYSPGRVDGVFGEATKNAVIKFQKANGLKGDGIVGAKTWGALLAASATPAPSKEPVYYGQGDSRWGSQMYSAVNNRAQTIASSGCGPTSMAMVISTLLAKVLPPEMCKLALSLKCRTVNEGTSWAFFPAVAKRHNLKCTQTGTTDTAVAALKAGKLVIASMGKGYFTKGGHYILLYATDGINIICHDPAKKTRDRAAISLFKRESKQYFIFEKGV